jgi:glycosyltransferase involved in cell wall biosynthesis
MHKNNGSVPLVTVGIPTYEPSDLFKWSLESVLQQDYPNFEVLIADDSRTSVVEQLVHEKNDQRIRLLRNTPAKGLLGSRQQIIDEARGEFLAWHDSDDVSTSNRLIEQVKALARAPFAELCGGWFTKREVTNHLSCSPPQSQLRQTEKCSLPFGLDLYRSGQLFGNLQPMSVLTQRTNHLNGARWVLDPSTETGEDCAMVSQSLSNERFTLVPKYLVCESKLPSGINATQKERQKQVLIRVMTEYARAQGVPQNLVNGGMAFRLAHETNTDLSASDVHEMFHWVETLERDFPKGLAVSKSSLRWWLNILLIRYLRDNRVQNLPNFVIDHLSFFIPKGVLPLGAAAFWRLTQSLTKTG